MQRIRAADSSVRERVPRSRPPGIDPAKEKSQAIENFICIADELHTRPLRPYALRPLNVQLNTRRASETGRINRSNNCATAPSS